MKVYKVGVMCYAGRGKKSVFGTIEKRNIGTTPNNTKYFINYKWYSGICVWTTHFKWDPPEYQGLGGQDNKYEEVEPIKNKNVL